MGDCRTGCIASAGVTTTRKYIVDISGGLPTILCVLDAADPNHLISSYTYTYADAQVLSQRQYTVPGDPNFYDTSFYVHDRLGSVRQVVDYNDIDAYAFVANSYTYSPFGSPYDGAPAAETVDNPFKFTGQYHDAEINQYHLRARQYDPTMMRFTSRDPIKNSPKNPLTINKYLYCQNDPMNNLDLDGKAAYKIMDVLEAGMEVHSAAIGTAAYGASTGDWRFIQLGIMMEQMVAPAMALRMMSLKPNISARFLSGGPGKMFNADQQVLVQIAKRAQKLGISKTEAKIMLEWGEEYGLKALNHMDLDHWIGGGHIHIGPINHIPTF